MAVVKETSVAKICTKRRVQMILVLLILVSFPVITTAFDWSEWWNGFFCFLCTRYEVTFENHLIGKFRQKEMVVKCAGNLSFYSDVEAKPNPVATVTFKVHSNYATSFTCDVTLSGSNFKRRFIIFDLAECRKYSNCKWQIHRYHYYAPTGEDTFAQKKYR